MRAQRWQTIVRLLFHRQMPSVHTVVGIILIQLFAHGLAPATLGVTSGVVLFFLYRERDSLKRLFEIRRVLVGLAIGVITVSADARSYSKILSPTRAAFTLQVVKPPNFSIPDQVTFIGEDREDQSGFLVAKTRVKVRSVYLPWKNSQTLKEGSIVRVRGNFHLLKEDSSSFDGYLRRKGVTYQGAADFISMPQPCPATFREKIQGLLFAQLENLLAEYPIGIALLESMILGQSVNVPPWIVGLYKETNLMHLLVISGMQISLIYFFVYSILRIILKVLSKLFQNSWRRTIEWFAHFPAIVFIAVYVYISGEDDAALRALTAIFIATLGRAGGFKTSVFQITMAMVAVSLMISPLCIYDVSFQLTAGALLGIALGLYAVGDRQQSKIMTGMYATIGASSVTSLISLVHFDTIATWGVLYNLLFSWPISLASCTFGIPALFIDYSIGKTFFLYLSAWSIEWLTRSVEFLSEHLPYAQNYTLGVGVSVTLLITLLLSALRRFQREWNVQ